MRRVFFYLVLAVLLLLFLPSAFAGDEKDVVTGEVEGVWTAGSSHLVDGYAFIPPEKALLIEEGVEITFLTSAVFNIMGKLIISGSDSLPVEIYAQDDWEGFNFLPGRSGNDSIRYLHVGIEGGIPRHVIRSNRRNLQISNCMFVGKESCLWISRGRIWADNNHFTSIGRFSKTVRFDSLESERISPWDPIDANYLTRSIVIADVPNAPIPPQILLFTTALFIEHSNETVLADNAFKVVAPGYAYGVFFGEPNSSSATGAALQHCVVAVRSYNVQARGVVNQYNGYLDVRRCNIDVGGGYHNPIGVSATNSAQITVNSCDLNVSTGHNFCTADDAARITVMFTNLWRSEASLLLFPQPPPEGERKDWETLKFDDLESVILGEGNIEEDPEFIAQAPWGEWKNMSDVRAYYSLSSTSPCIDRGDMTIGLDPDNTRADIGCFYYSQTGSSAIQDGRHSVPQSLVLAPYPNPFNATTVVPFSLERAGTVRLIVYDILGRPVADLANGRFSVGSHLARFHARGLASGLYFVTMELDGIQVGQQKLMLIR